MSTIRIFSKKAFSFGPGAVRGSTSIENFVTVPGTFQDMPDKYEKDPTFQIALKYHEVEVVNQIVHSSAKVVKTEEKIVDDSNKDSDIEKFYEELKAKSKDEVKELAEKYNAEFVDTDPLKVNKKRVLESYKIFVSEN